MGVEVLGVPNEGNGWGDSMDAMRAAHDSNSRILINLAMGRKKNAPTPHYDPNHADNQWPVMLYHAAKGEKLFGRSLLGSMFADRADIEKANAASVEQAKKDGYRAEPYLKPQIAVLDPAAEKKALLDKNQELEGKIIAMGDAVSKMQQQLAGKPDTATKVDTTTKVDPKK